MGQRLLTVLVCLLAACSSNNDDRPVDDVDTSDDVEGTVDAGADLGEPSCAPFAELGPDSVGVRTAQIAGATVELFYPAEPGEAFDTYDLRDWMLPDDQDKIPDDVAPLYEYPAYRDATPKAGPYPIVLFSHGFGGYRLQSSVLVATIASWGYVVVAPEHPERNLTAVLESGVPETDLSAETLVAVLDALEADGAADVPELDFDRIAVGGHSAGGAAAMRIGADPRFDLVFGWATASFEDIASFDNPSAILAGTADRLATATRGRELYDSRALPRLFASVENAGHLAFSDICLIGRDEGGVLSIAMEYGVTVPAILQTLAKDGCLPQDLPAEDAWPLVNQLTIASLEQHLRGTPPVDVEATMACFGELVAEIESE